MDPCVCNLLGPSLKVFGLGVAFHLALWACMTLSAASSFGAVQGARSFAIHTGPDTLSLGARTPFGETRGQTGPRSKKASAARAGKAAPDQAPFSKRGKEPSVNTRPVAVSVHGCCPRDSYGPLPALP